MKKTAFSLRYILMFSFILLGGLPILVMGFIAIKLISADIDREVRAKNLLIAQSLSSEVQDFLGSSLSSLRLIEDTIIEKQYVKRNEINSFLGGILKRHLELDSLVILDQKGTVRFMAPYNQDVMDMNLSGQPFFSRVNQYGEPYWSSTFISLQTGKPTLTLAIPVRGGMIVGYLNLATLNAITDRVLVGGLAYTMIIDREGTIIAHPDRNKVFERQNLRHLEFIGQGKQPVEGNFTYREEDKDYLASLCLVLHTQWTVIVAVPADEAFAPVTRVRTLFVVGAAIVILLTVGIVFFSLRKVSNPLSQLVRDARTIADGSYIFKEKASGYKEIDELTDNFRRMAGAIQGREEALKESKETLNTMSLTDELTGLCNRRGFFTLAQQQMKVTERTKKDMLLFFADLDKLKHINDTLGHQEGDKALIEAATILKEVFRESDIIGRMGGDEFAILAIDTTDETREVLIKRLQNYLDDYNRPEGRNYTLYLSIGIAHYDPEKPSTLDELMAQADTLMYEQKRSKQG